MAPVNVRNLEQIQESDAGARPSRLGALVLASLASAAVAVSFVVMSQRTGPAAASSADPLAELLASAKAASPAERLERNEVTFPGVLSDAENPTTALAAVKDARGRLVVQSSASPPLPASPPPATDRLPVAPLPVGALLGATAVTNDPKDPLTQMAAGAARASEETELAPGGLDGGFQLQVASFKDQADADRLVEDLRRRGHRAFRQAAYVTDRGLWYRVRIGPFKSRFEAQKYKSEFERNERVSPFLVDPEKVKQAEQLKAARVAAEQKRAQRRAASNR
jgi:cell division septation protein DedD